VFEGICPRINTNHHAIPCHSEKAPVEVRQSFQTQTYPPSSELSPDSALEFYLALPVSVTTRPQRSEVDRKSMDDVPSLLIHGLRKAYAVSEVQLRSGLENGKR